MDDLERVQKAAVRLINGKPYESYSETLKQLGILRLSERREVICLKFAKNCLRLENFRKLFPKHASKHDMQTRHEERYQVNRSNGKRHAISAIPNMLKLLNKDYKEQKQNLKKLKKSVLSPTNFACTRIYCWDNKPIIIIIIIKRISKKNMEKYSSFAGKSMPMGEKISNFSMNGVYDK